MLCSKVSIPCFISHCNKQYFGVFLFYILIVALDQGKDSVIRCVCPTDKGTLITISHISSCQVKSSCRHDLIFYHILDFFYRYCTVKSATFKFHKLNYIFNLSVCQTSVFCFRICFCHCPDYFLIIKYFFRTISLNNLHTIRLSLIKYHFLHVLRIRLVLFYYKILCVSIVYCALYCIHSPALSKKLKKASF